MPTRSLRPRRVRRSRQRGVGLIEVLIAVLLLGIGMLAMAALLTSTLRFSQSSLERSQAIVQSYAIVDMMRANRAVALAGGYNQTLASATEVANSDKNTTTSGTATAPTRPQAEVRQWLGTLQNALGAGSKGAINCVSSTAACEVTLQWDDSRGAAGKNAAANEQSTSTADSSQATRIKIQVRL